MLFTLACSICSFIKIQHWLFTRPYQALSLQYGVPKGVLDCKAKFSVSKLIPFHKIKQDSKRRGSNWGLSCPHWALWIFDDDVDAMKAAWNSERCGIWCRSMTLSLLTAAKAVLTHYFPELPKRQDRANKPRIWLWSFVGRVNPDLSVFMKRISMLMRIARSV